jgi:hypothetical protein
MTLGRDTQPHESACLHAGPNRGLSEQANEGGPVGASAGAVGTPLTGIETALVDELGHKTGVAAPSAPLGGFETPPARGS